MAPHQMWGLDEIHGCTDPEIATAMSKFGRPQFGLVDFRNQVAGNLRSADASGDLPDADSNLKIKIAPNLFQFQQIYRFAVPRNAAVETIFKTIKAELIWRRSQEPRRQVEMTVFECAKGFHNPRHRHSMPVWKSTVAFERKVAQASTCGGSKAGQAQCDIRRLWVNSEPA